jgi:prophage tail gpP-like protein
MSDQDAVSLNVGGKIIEGWDSVRVTGVLSAFRLISAWG